MLFGYVRRLADNVINGLILENDLIIGINEPYNGHLLGDSIDQHARSKNRLNVLIEVRNDLIRTADKQTSWARFLAPILQKALIYSKTNP